MFSYILGAGGDDQGTTHVEPQTILKGSTVVFVFGPTVTEWSNKRLLLRTSLLSAACSHLVTLRSRGKWDLSDCSPQTQEIHLAIM